MKCQVGSGVRSGITNRSCCWIASRASGAAIKADCIHHVPLFPSKRTGQAYLDISAQCRYCWKSIFDHPSATAEKGDDLAALRSIPSSDKQSHISLSVCLGPRNPSLTLPIGTSRNEIVSGPPTETPFSLSLAKPQPDKREATSDDEGDPAHPHRYRPVSDGDGPVHNNPHQVDQRHHGEDHPSHKKKRFASMGRHPKFLTHDSTLKGSRFSIFCRMTGPKDGHCERLDMSG